MTAPSWCQAGSPVTNTAARPVLVSISCATGFLLYRGEWDDQGVECLASVVGRHDAEGSAAAVVEEIHPRPIRVQGGSQLEDLQQDGRVEAQYHGGRALGQDLAHIRPATGLGRRDGELAALTSEDQ